MTLLGQVLIAASVLAVGVVYGTDVFSAIVLRPALALVDDRTLVSAMGRVHDFGDRRLRLPGIAGLVTAVAGTAVIAWAGHWGATIAGAVAVVALASWLVIYVRISAPVNARLKGAAQGDDVVMHSPILTESLTGRDQVLGVLGAVFDAVDEFVLGEVLSGPAWSPSRTGLLQP